MKISSQRVLLLGLSTATALLFAARIQAETWSFDPTFQRAPLRVTSESAYALKVLSSGKVLTYSINGGLLSGANGQRIGALLRIDPNTGAIDPTWNPDPTVTGYGLAGVAEAPDGKIYYATAVVGEIATDMDDPAVNRLVRLNTDGSRDPSFNSPVFAIGARFLGVQPDGKIIVCSGGLNLSGVPPAGSIVQTVRLNTDGTLDNTFQSPNFQMNASDPPADVASGEYFDAGVFGNPVVDPVTGKIYFCGTFKFVNGQPRKSIVRCNADGTLDSSFVPTGLIGGSPPLIARAMVLQASGKIVLSGNNLRTAAGGSTRYALLRFNTDGTLDNTFTLFATTNSSGVALVPGYTGPRDIHTLPGGNILTSGERVLRFLPDGTLDSTFTPLDYSSPFFTPNGTNGAIAAFRFDVDPNTGAAYLPNPGPLYARLGGVPVPGEITKLTPGGTIDTSFNSPVVEFEDFAPNVQIAANGAVYVSGHHTAFGNTGNATIARLFPDGTRDPGFALDALPFADKQASDVALFPDNSSYVMYYSGSFNGGYEFSNFVRLSPGGALDTTFRPSPALQSALSVNAFDGNDTAKLALPQVSAAPGGKAYLFTASAQATVNANGNLKLIRVNADGTEDTSVAPLGFPVGEVTRDANGITGGSTGYILRLAKTPDGGFFVLASVAPFPTLTGDPYNYKVIKFLADGSFDPNFVAPVLESSEPATQDFLSLFDPVSGFTRQPPNGFYREGNDRVAGLGMFPDGSVLLDGDFHIANSNPVIKSPIKLTPTGALDSSFSVPSGGLQNLANPSRPALATKVRIAPNGKIWVLGRFDTAGGNPAPGVTRLNSNGTPDTTFNLTGVSYYDSYGDFADVVFANNSTAYLIGTFRHTGDPLPFPITRILQLPTITSPLTAAGNVGQQFTYQLLATDATSLGANNLPAGSGLTFNASLGAIIGTPTTAGTFPVGLSASNAAGTTTATLTLTVQPAPPAGPVIASSTSATGRVGQPFSFQVITTGGSAASRVTATGLPPGLVIDAVTGLISGTPTTDGSSAVSLTITDGNLTTTNVLQLTFTADPTIPVIISSSSASLTPGQAFSYTIVAPATSDPSDVTTYTLVGTLPNGLFFNAQTGVISGTFTVNFQNRAESPDHITLSGGIVSNVQIFATNSHGTSTIPLNFFLAPTGAVNIATRLAVGTGNNVLIAGFIITGNAPKKVIIRAIGPSLPLPGALQDPTLELHNGASLLGSNDNWRDSQENEIIATTIPPTDNRESAIVATLTPGNYTAVVAGSGDTTGIAVVELYDLGTAGLDTSSKAQLAQISTRGTVLGDDNVMIGGFIISGSASKVIVRAIGPSLNGILPGALQDTILELHDSSGATLLSNDDWRSDQEQQIIDTTVQPTDNRESAIVATLSPGAYTGIVRGKDSATGVALVEVYGLQ